MNTLIINQENKQIKDLINTYNSNLSILKSKKEAINKKSQFTDSLNDSFHMGRVGFMNKKDNARKERELNNFIDSCNTEREINTKIKEVEGGLKKLNTGNYLIRKNGLRVKTYRYLKEELTTIQKMLKTGIYKDEPLTQELKKGLKDLERETKKTIKQREKAIK